MKLNEIEQFLPGIIQQTLPKAGEENLLTWMLALMEHLHEQPDAVLENLADYFDPYLTPTQFLPYLASWLALDTLWIDRQDTASDTAYPMFPSGWEQLRVLIANIVTISRYRGTGKGLRLFLETATGITGFKVSDAVWENGAIKPFHIRVTVPAGVKEQHHILIERIVRQEKPAYVTYELSYARSLTDFNPKPED